MWLKHVRRPGPSPQNTLARSFSSPSDVKRGRMMAAMNTFQHRKEIRKRASTSARRDIERLLRARPGRTTRRRSAHPGPLRANTSSRLAELSRSRSPLPCWAERRCTEGGQQRMGQRLEGESSPWPRTKRILAAAGHARHVDCRPTKSPRMGPWPTPVMQSSRPRGMLASVPVESPSNTARAVANPRPGAAVAMSQPSDGQPEKRPAGLPFRPLGRLMAFALQSAPTRATGSAIGSSRPTKADLPLPGHATGGYAVGWMCGGLVAKVAGVSLSPSGSWGHGEASFCSAMRGRCGGRRFVHAACPSCLRAFVRLPTSSTPPDLLSVRARLSSHIDPFATEQRHFEQALRRDSPPPFSDHRPSRCCVASARSELASVWPPLPRRAMRRDRTARVTFGTEPHPDWRAGL